MENWLFDFVLKKINILIKNFSTQNKKEIIRLQNIGGRVNFTATSPSRKLILYISIIAQMQVVPMAATYRSLSIELKN
jgi:hypothetical protein